MRKSQHSGRQLKKRIQKLLLQQDLESGLAQIGDMPARKAINPLFSFLCSLDELLKWRAVMAMGEVVDRLAAELYQLAGHHAARHRDDFDWQGERSEDIHQLAAIGDAGYRTEKHPC